MSDKSFGFEDDLKATADKEETKVDLKSYIILRNFSGEDFDKARVMLDYGEAFEQGIDHEETKQLLFLKAPEVPVTKVWTWDAASLPWDPTKLDNQNVGIPVSYRIVNDAKSNLGKFAMWGGIEPWVVQPYSGPANPFRGRHL